MKTSPRAGVQVVALACLVAAPACSLFVSLDGLSDGDASDSGSAADGAVIDAGTNDGNATDASSDVGGDGGDASSGSVAPQFRALASANNTTNGNAMVVARVAQIKPGDLMIALVYQFNFGSTVMAPDLTWTENSGFSDPGPSYEVAFYWKLATASEPSSYTFTGNTTGYAEVDLVAYSGVSQTNPFDQSNAMTYQNVSSYATPPLTTSFAHTLLVITAVADGQSSAVWNAPSGVASRKASGYTFVGDEPQTAAGASSMFTIACAVSGTVSSGGIAIAALTPE